MGKTNTIGFEVRTLSNLIKRKIDHMTAEEEPDITSMHGWIIGYLFDNKDIDIYQRDIEEHFTIRRSTVTSLLQLMEKRKLIIRQSVSGDARLKKIVLTKKSLLIHERMCFRLDCFEESLISGISSEDVEIFKKVVEHMKQNIE
ncbi:MAG: MarR family winged helix-turn-helix transcriptional regulator [Velocimicrobium sp.]